MEISELQPALDSRVRSLLALALLLFLAAVALLSSPCAQASSSSFVVKAPATWLAQGDGLTSDAKTNDKQLYINSASKLNERIVLEVEPISLKAAAFQSHLNEKRRELSDLRARFFATAGLANYTALEIRSETKIPKGFQSLTVVQSHYVNQGGRDVQMIERQFVSGAKLMTVIYLVDRASITDFEHVQRVMDDFMPIAIGARAPASETVASDATPTGPASTEAPELLVQPVVDLDMKIPANRSRCEAFCKDDPSKCRNADSKGLLDDSSIGLESVGCFKGLAQGVWGMAEGLWSAAAFTWNYTKSWVTGDDYKTQVHAAVGAVASELYNDPKGMAKRLGAALWNAGRRSLGDFFDCANPAEQWRQLCKVGSNFIPVGLAYKLLVKAPMTALEWAQVDAAFTKGAEAGMVLKKAEIPTSPPFSAAANTDRASETLASKSVEGAASEKLPVAKVEELERAYGNELKGLDEDKNEIYAQIFRQRLRGVTDDQIKNAIREARTSCKVR